MAQAIASEFLASARWRRDPGISELIEYLDQPKFLIATPSGSYGDFDALSSADWNLIEKETLRCQSDFVYAAKNYFWITNKDTGDQLFSLWESQELILEEILKVRAMGLAQKFIILKARQLGALHPDTKVLTATLEWKRIGDLQVGEEIIAVDEMPISGQGAGRKFRTATILRKWEVEKQSFRLTLENGNVIIATGDHPFLCKKRGGVDTQWRTVNEPGPGQWSSSKIRAGDVIRYMCDQWDQEITFEDGWFSGLLDGEGSLRAKDGGGIELSVSQVAGAVLERAKQYLRNNQYSFRIEVDRRKPGKSSKFGKQPVYKLVLNKMPDIFKILGRLKPSRFAGRRVWEGKELPENGDANWAKVISVEPIGKRKMVDIETTTKTFIADGFVTHNCSTLIEAMIAWSTMFNTNINAIVVGPEIKRTQYLFSIMLHIYDQMPWWLKPLVANREFKEGLFFNNPDVDQRRVRPGLNSRIELQTASQYSGIGEGIRLTALHVSELASWQQHVAREAIDGDLGNALAEKSPMTFAVIESTAKGAGTYYHDLWRTNIEAGEDADWRCIFLPFFFEKTRVEAPPMGWRPGKLDDLMREQIQNQWVRCDNEECGRWRESMELGVPLAETICPHCKLGTLHPYILNDEQLRFMEKKRKNAERKGADSVKELKQELSATAEECFQLSGDPVFPLDCLDFAEKNVREPILQAFLDKEGRVHGMVKLKRDPVTGQVCGSVCFQTWCSEDHRWDDCPLKIWELPMKDHEYSMGVDVAEGLGGKHDYSVIVVNRIGKGLNPDVQVATWRSNEINHYDLAVPVVQLGKWYNYAVACIEYNTYQTCADHVRIMYSYPNIYRWKNLDSSSVMTTKWHWITQGDSKPKLWGAAVRRLRQQTWIPRSANLLTEMKMFQKDEDSEKKAEASSGFKDDELIAAMISEYCAHELDQVYDNRAASTSHPVEADEELVKKDFDLTCIKCGYKFEHHEPPRPSNPPNVRCEKCGSIMLTARRKGVNTKAVGRINPEQLEERSVAENGIPLYDDL